MEQVSRKLLDNSETKRLGASENSSRSWSDLTSLEQEDYLMPMMQVINDSYSLAMQNPTLEEKASIARVWARHLYGSIPQEGLEPAFEAARKNHTSTFPITAIEVQNAWNALEQERCKEEMLVLAGDLDRPGMCPVCLDTGFTYHRECRPNGKWYDGVRKSTDCCRYWQRRLAAETSQGRR